MKTEILANGNYVFTLEEDDREDMQRIVERCGAGSHEAMAQFTDWMGFQGDGGGAVHPSQVGAMTDAPMFTDDYTYDDEGNFSIGQLWYHASYMVENFLDVLLETGSVVFTLHRE